MLITENQQENAKHGVILEIMQWFTYVTKVFQRACDIYQLKADYCNGFLHPSSPNTTFINISDTVES